MPSEPSFLSSAGDDCTEGRAEVNKKHLHKTILFSTWARVRRSAADMPSLVEWLPQHAN